MTTAEWRVANPGKVKAYNDSRRKHPTRQVCVVCGEAFYAVRQRATCTARCHQRKRDSRLVPCVECGDPCCIRRGRCRRCSLLRGQTCAVPWKKCRCGRTFIGRGRRTKCGVGHCPRRTREEFCARVGCSAPFKTIHPHQKYCSETCAKRVQRREAKHRRRDRQRGGERVIFRKVCERDGWCCHICGKKVDAQLAVPHPLAPTRDHVIPLALGGRHEMGNVRLAHFICNSRRGMGGGNEQLLLVA